MSSPSSRRLNVVDDIRRVGHPPFAGQHARVLAARPQALHFDPASTALIVVDMQNAYISAGGYMDQAGFDISLASGAVAGTRRALDTAHAAGMQVIYLQNGWDGQYAEAGGPDSPNWHKSNALRVMRERADLDGKLLSKGGWDYALVDELAPQEGDLVVAKTRYSGFFNSTLDGILRARGVRTLLFAGIATNVCVESTLRDAYHHEYFCALLDDATTQAGPAFTRQAALYNIETFFGWVSDVESFARALQPQAA
ncbi:isochorismatase family protein [Bordetella petrii]|uniref:isochorismatase family protein n=1 Tax=Bordetella petrii TaxID=94624 RepID=UPI001E3F22BD|nr:isochorismatase family protein [Bordetella petrii]MCD0503116.1 isochorismatase family protein [Bordetella petrii]